VKTNDTPAANGILTSDIILTRAHILTSILLDSPYKLLAADVDGSGDIDTADIIRMRGLILGNTTDFPAGLWRFVPEDHVFPDEQNPWDAPTNLCYTGLSSNAVQNFVAIKLGDVDADWSPPAEAASPATAPARTGEQLVQAAALGTQVGFAVSSHDARQGERVTARVSINDFEGVTGAQFTLGWNPAVLKFVEFGDFGLRGLSVGSFGTKYTDDGRLALSWDDPQLSGVTLPDESVLFTVEFEVVGDTGSVSPLQLLDSPTARETVIGLTPVTFASQDGGVNVIASSLPAPTLSSIGHVNGAFQLAVPTVSGRRYVLEHTESLLNDQWTELSTIIGGGVTVLTDTSATNKQGFYRVRVD
jgi:hypothetical protein